MRQRILFLFILPAIPFLLISTQLSFAQISWALVVGCSVLIITKQGMVLAADSRTTYRNGRHDDNAVKILKLQSSGCMVAGVVERPPSRGNLGFSLRDQIQSISWNPSFHDNTTIYESVLKWRLSTAIGRELSMCPRQTFSKMIKKLLRC